MMISCGAAATGRRRLWRSFATRPNAGRSASVVPSHDTTNVHRRRRVSISGGVDSVQAVEPASPATQSTTAE